jgi:Arabinose efflux permease
MDTISKPAPWYSNLTRTDKNALIGGLGAWTMDAMDVLLYVMSLGAIKAEFGISNTMSGALASVTLASSALGGIMFGILADKIGRKKALVLAVALYSAFTGLSAIASSAMELAVYRCILGLGMGGAWAAGALLVNETWPAEHRGKASGFMQSGWALGYMLAALLSGLILKPFGWRALFLVGVIPSVCILIFILLRCEEPKIWLEQKHMPKTVDEDKGSFFDIFRGNLLRFTIIGTLFAAFAQLGYWGLFTWLPTFLSTPPEAGGAGMDIVKTSGWVFVMQIGALIGYTGFGFVSDRYGRKAAFALFMLVAAILVPIYGSLRSPMLLFLCGPLIGCFGSGYFSGFGAMLSELFPTKQRGAGLGFVYNMGRGASALAPIIIGTLADTFGIGTALFITSFFLCCALCVLYFLPETKGLRLK